MLKFLQTWACAVMGPSIVILAVLFPATGLRAEERPVIRVGLKFEGGLSGLISPESREVIKARAENRLCELAEKRWGFLDWSNDPAVETSAEWEITFNVETRQITNDTGGLSKGTIASLGHTGVLASHPFPFRQTEDNETIYPIGRLIPFNDPAALGDDIDSQLDRQLTSLLESQEVKLFLKKIPIVERIIADADNTRLVVPVKTNDLRTDEDSILRVDFRDSNNRPGRLDLETTESVMDDGQYKGYVVAWVTDLRLHQVSIATPTPWDDKLLPVINSATDVKVYMNVYNPSLTPAPVSADGIVTDPGAEQ